MCNPEAVLLEGKSLLFQKILFVLVFLESYNVDNLKARCKFASIFKIKFQWQKLWLAPVSNARDCLEIS